MSPRDTHPKRASSRQQAAGETEVLCHCPRCRTASREARAPEAFWPLHEAVTNTCRHGRPPVSTVRPKPSEPRRPGPQGARRGRPDCSPVTEKSCALIAALCLYFATTPRDNVRRPLRGAWLENSQPGGCVLLPDNLHLGVPSPNHLLKETLPLNL